MGNMREVSPTRPKPRHRSQGFLDGRMGWMRIMPQGIEKQNIEPGQLLQALRRNLTVIGQVGAIAEFEAVGRSFAVANTYRQYRDSRNIDCFLVKDMRCQPRPAGLGWRCIENVLKRPLDDFQRFGRRVDRDVMPLHEIEGPDIIETKNVIGVRVRVKNGIEARDTKAERLIAKIRRCVDQNSLFIQAKEYRRTKPLIARVSGRANRAAATDHGHAYAGSGAEHQDGRVLELFEHLLGFRSFSAVGRDD